jgi:hypothetical protein
LGYTGECKEAGRSSEKEPFFREMMKVDDLTIERDKK